MADLEVRCAECDTVIKDAEFKKYGQTSAALFVNPCAKCLSDSKAEGYDQGQSSGGVK